MNRVLAFIACVVVMFSILFHCTISADQTEESKYKTNLASLKKLDKSISSKNKNTRKKADKFNKTADLLKQNYNKEISTSVANRNKILKSIQEQIDEKTQALNKAEADLKEAKNKGNNKKADELQAQVVQYNEEIANLKLDYKDDKEMYDTHISELQTKISSIDGISNDGVNAANSKISSLNRKINKETDLMKKSAKATEFKSANMYYKRLKTKKNKLIKRYGELSKAYKAKLKLLSSL